MSIGRYAVSELCSEHGLSNTEAPRAHGARAPWRVFIIVGKHRIDCKVPVNTH